MTDTHPEYRACPGATADENTIDWYFPAKQGDNEKLEKWCQTLGTPVFRADPSPAFGQLELDDSVAVAVFNPDGGSGDLLGFIRDELGLDCSLPSTGRRADRSHFVLLLQEALRRSNDIPDVSKRYETLRAVDNTRPDSVLDVVEVAEHCGLGVFYMPAVRNGWEERDGKREDKGNAILSTLPLSDPIAIELPLEGARRAMAAATIHSASGDSLRVATVHLETTAGLWRLIRTGNSSRLRQALAIVDVLDRIEVERGKSITDAEHPPYATNTILAGDLNIWTTSETSFRRLWEHFPDSPRPLEEGTRGPFPTDHILFRRTTLSPSSATIVQQSYRHVDTEFGSDHRPSLAWFRFGT
jgi:endonuclease/exonuclease/phosphatase family metal-dependent hydrolase